MNRIYFCTHAALACLLCLLINATNLQAQTIERMPKLDISPVIAHKMMSKKRSELKEGWQQGAFMQVFVRSYSDSNGDGVGDLRGLIQSLDYLQDLGVKGLWLMPINHSQDKDHGYAVQDYRNIEPAYGTLADFDELLKQAHARGIGIIIDYVINHSAAKNPLFEASASSPKNRYRDWYMWKDVAPEGWSFWNRNPWVATKQGAYFAAFADFMPDFNLRNPKVVAYHQNNLRFWLNRGLDGFRFDAVGNLFENGPQAWENQPENYVFMGKMRETIAQYPQRFVVCEGPDHDHLRYAAQSACASAFAFKHNKNIIDAARGNTAAIQAVADYFTQVPLTMATMLSNHDSHGGQRAWDQFAGNIAQYKLAAATYLLGAGTPFIYYGEEVGMAGSATLTGDPKLRTPMSWNSDADTGGFTTANPYRSLAANVSTQNLAVQKQDPNSLLFFYKQLLKVRNSLPSIARGTYERPLVNGQVLSYQRKFQSEHSVVVINYGMSTAKLELLNLPANKSLKIILPEGDEPSSRIAINASGQALVEMKLQSVIVLKVE
jgi:alpha-amylase